jgi:hypothetical protein
MAASTPRCDIARRIRLAARQRRYRRILDALSCSGVIATELGQDLTALPSRVLLPHALVIALTPLLDERFAQAVRRLASGARTLSCSPSGPTRCLWGYCRRATLGRWCAGCGG